MFSDIYFSCLTYYLDKKQMMHVLKNNDIMKDILKRSLGMGIISAEGQRAEGHYVDTCWIDWKV